MNGLDWIGGWERKKERVVWCGVGEVNYVCIHWGHSEVR
jgi:hypothetical protein